MHFLTVFIMHEKIINLVRWAPHGHFHDDCILNIYTALSLVPFSHNFFGSLKTVIAIFDIN